MPRWFFLILFALALMPACADEGNQDPVRGDADGDGYTTEEGACDDGAIDGMHMP